MSISIIDLVQLIKKFKIKFLNEPTTKYSWQYFFNGAEDVVYYPVKCHCVDGYSCRKHERKALIDQDLIEHFSGKPVDLGKNNYKGCLAVTALQNKRFKWFVVDSDNEASTIALTSKLIPVLKSYSIDYIYERGSQDYKCHIWFMVDCSVETLSDFSEQLFKEADIQYNSRDRDLQLEIYPINKPNSLIRIPGGVHLRNKEVNPITFRNITSSDPKFILESFTNAIQYSEEQIKAWTKPMAPVKQSIDFPVEGERKRLFSANLEFNYPHPESLKPLISNCQAVNKLLTATIEDKALNKRGGGVHNSGLYLSNVIAHSDWINQTSEGMDWLLDLVEKYRDRDAQSHKWFNKVQRSSKTNIKVPFCNTWRRDLDLCGGCPFTRDIHSPKVLSQHPPIDLRPKLVKALELKTLEQIRGTTFKTVKERVYSYVENAIEQDILLASPMASGKSTLISEISAELAKKGKNVLIAVPTADLALDHRKRLRDRGVEPFILMSHENLFKKDEGKRRFNIDFDCPKQEDITYFNDLGVEPHIWRKKFCGTCKFKDACPYPGQYTKAAEGDSNVVIIQHAHLSLRETMFSLINKKYFDVLIVDEEFIDSLVEEFKITEQEIAILDKFKDEISWIERLLKWINGASEDFQVISTKQGQLESLKAAFEEMLLPWHLPLYISNYNYKNTYSIESGLFIFSPLPNIPIRIFTDATPPIEMLKIVLNNPFIEVFGKNEILNYLDLNPDNKIIQILDNSSSKTSMSLKEGSKMDRVLWSIGKLMKIKYKGLQTLLITYSGTYEDYVKKFFRLNFPELLEQLTIGRMSVGTNKYESCKVMFQLAGVHLNSRQLAFASYRLKSIENYWHRLAGEPQIENEYPDNIQPLDYTPQTAVPLCRVEIHDGVSGLYEYLYPMYKSWYPEDNYKRYCHLLALAKRQQAMRLRFNDGQERHAYLFDYSIRETLLITNTIVLDEFTS